MRLKQRENLSVSIYIVKVRTDVSEEDGEENPCKIQKTWLNKPIPLFRKQIFHFIEIN